MSIVSTNKTRSLKRSTRSRSVGLALADAVLLASVFAGSGGG